MITRAQAEALLTLAESLEACEKLGIVIEHYSDVFINVGSTYRQAVITGAGIRLAVHAMTPKQET